MASIDISGINKVNLLEVLWKNAKASPYFNGTTPVFNEAMALRESTGGNWKFDYVHGKAMKCDISGDTAEFRHYGGYDRDAGNGAFQRCVDQLRS